MLFTSGRGRGIIRDMEQRKRKTTYGMTREQEQAASRLFGRHVSGAKALALCVASVLACASPMLLGLRLWTAIPPVVTTGFVSTEGVDDSLPRAVLVFGVPGLFCVLDLICHAQLWLHQRAQKLPPMSVRMLGRWTLAVLSVLLCTFWLRRAAGETASAAVFAPCLLALLLLLLGAHFFDCPRGEQLALRLPCIWYKEEAWRRTQRFAGVCCMLAGLLLLGLYFGTGKLPALSAVPLLLLLLAPLPAARLYAGKENKE